jgi:hypothetical protein
VFLFLRRMLLCKTESTFLYVSPIIVSSCLYRTAVKGPRNVLEKIESHRIFPSQATDTSNTSPNSKNRMLTTSLNSLSLSQAIGSAGGALLPLKIILTCSNFGQGQKNYIKIRPEHLSFSTRSNYNKTIREINEEIIL